MTQDTPEIWAQATRQFQQTFGDSWMKLFQSFQGLDLGPGGAGTLPLPEHPVSIAPDKLQQLQQQYLHDLGQLMQHGAGAVVPSGDKRFAAKAWGDNPLAALSAAAYQLNARLLLQMADAVQADAKTRARIRFAVEQWVAASAPSNFLALNAEAQQKAIETHGESIAKGMHNLVHDQIGRAHV